MSVHFLKEIEHLKREVYEMSALVEESVRRAVRAIETRDADLGRRVMEGDRAIDEKEIKVEEECLKILALHQPVAADLRFVVAVLKINSDLERIADLAVNVARRAVFVSSRPMPDVSLSYAPMADKVQAMVKRALDALVNLDSAAARDVCRADDDVDAMKKVMQEVILAAIHRNPRPENVDVLFNLLSVSRHLERIADHATNIAEDLIYMVEGRIVRHIPDDKPRT